MDITQELIGKVVQIAYQAGRAIMEIYEKPFGFELKSDNSPLTLADKRAHEIIMAGLISTGLPVLSEEGAQISFETRDTWMDYWLVDPLDGTKEFIKKNGDFTVNIALVSNHQPVFGVVYAPVPDVLYWGSHSGSFRLKVKQLNPAASENFGEIELLAERLPCIERNEGFLVLGSRSHMNEQTEAFINDLRELHPDLSFVSRGSSLKFCTLAEGGADIYPRFGPTMEWDTAAGHAVALFAGCEVNQASSGLPLYYNKPALLNPFFIARIKKKMR
ncbi:MAG: 3'(2'),5'-bisphosphate nucleotidase CysQ [Bacteroidota bacterium]